MHFFNDDTTVDPVFDARLRTTWTFRTAQPYPVNLGTSSPQIPEAVPSITRR